ncbi:UV radiation resistance protein and autophagy-related subunit 14-domain-containing protein [Zalerion maritima]|uniref:Autophagy-related protein 14 n=1 Tax=Zalerion maritima TaxID=339359 RepID=A0AAD5RL66_9PEZI|nr:UV radiation resistance protein and autophagy-related subunit 14-domain-containing protein [Zalerion maritima]
MSSTESTRPHLLPQNRRLRHLKGLYLRNLTFSRPRGRTIDDSAINIPPTKHTHLGKAPALHHAASSESLRKLRRRSEANLGAGATPQDRQQKLEKTIENRVADVIFSVHTDVEEDPIYISETIEKATNFNFQIFDLTLLNPLISRLNYVVIKVWAKRHDWCLLLEESLQLSDLNFVGPIHNQQFPPNCVLFHLIDGIYSLDLTPTKPTTPKDAPPMLTSSYNELMKIVTLENSIQDALATRASLEDKINSILKCNAIKELPRQQEETKEAENTVAQQHRALQAAKDKRDRLRASIAARKKAIHDGTVAQNQAEKDVDTASSKLPSSYALINESKSLIHGQRRRLCEDLSNIFPITPVPNGPPLAFQILQLPLPNTEYDPTSNSTQEQTLSAALGYVAYIILALQFYLGVPVPYEIKSFGSRSSIRDEISILQDPQKEYPLYLRGGASAQARLDYGWFLLNKDIEALCGALNLRVVDIRHTLPNIKYLLYVGSAGKDELPERKRGGVRGLLMGRVRQRLTESDYGGSTIGGDRGSRRGSTDSDFLARQREEIQRAIRESSSMLDRGMGSLNGKGLAQGRIDGATTNGSVLSSEDGSGRGARDQPNLDSDLNLNLVEEPGEVRNNNSILASPTQRPMAMLFDEAQKLSLRTKGMREQHART